MCLQISRVSNKILHDISFSVSPGETLIITGPSGAGKTTLLRTIAGLEALEKGTIFLKNREISGLPAYQRNIGMVFQNHALFPHLDVRKNIEFPLRRKGASQKEIFSKVEHFLEILQISPLAKRYPSSLSGGEKQRVALAQILSFSPDALLLDEPLAHLDIPNKKILQTEIKNFQKKCNFPLVYVTHDPWEAKKMGDRFVFLNSGKLCQEEKTWIPT